MIELNKQQCLLLLEKKELTIMSSNNYSNLLGIECKISFNKRSPFAKVLVKKKKDLNESLKVYDIKLIEQIGELVI